MSGAVSNRRVAATVRDSSMSPPQMSPNSHAHQADAVRERLADPQADMRARMQRQGQWQPHQMAGRRWPIACVSLEITQRCNLDCTLCYLSDSAEAVLDFPLEEVFRRIDLIVTHYGPGTDVQVSGGEPTLRRREGLRAPQGEVRRLLRPQRQGGAATSVLRARQGERRHPRRAHGSAAGQVDTEIALVRGRRRRLRNDGGESATEDTGRTGT